MAEPAKSIGPCTFCDRVGPLCDDHIPPKGIFPRPRPNNLITVPACFDCNSGASGHEEYFRLMLSLNQDLASNPALAAVRETAFRSLEKPTKTGLKIAIEEATRSFCLFDPKGKPVSQRETITVNVDRLNFVVSKTTAGLYFKLFNMRIGTEMTVGSQIESELDMDHTQELHDLRSFLMDQEPVIAYPHVYTGRVVRGDPDDNRVTIWQHVFYEGVAFISATIPKRVLHERTSELGGLTCV